MRQQVTAPRAYTELRCRKSESIATAKARVLSTLLRNRLSRITSASIM